MGRGLHRGFITHDELNKSLGKRSSTLDNLEKAFLHIFDNKVALVEKKSDYKAVRKKESSHIEEGKSQDKSDDPIRMYLREMGGVELLSREGEIAIAKRIEAGKDVMLHALAQSPITGKKVFDWHNRLNNEEIMVREIIDIDTNYTEDEDEDNVHKEAAQSDKKMPKNTKNNLEDKKEKGSGESDTNKQEEEDEFNPTLAAMENEIKPKVLKTIFDLTKNYNRLIKYQNNKLNAILNSNIFSKSKEKKL